MKFTIETASYFGDGTFGNTEKIAHLKGKTVNIESIEDLKMISDEVETELIINFRENTITIYDDYIE